jgi:DNA-directed RNA polymerase subunit K/omega
MSLDISLIPEQEFEPPSQSQRKPCLWISRYEYVTLIFARSLQLLTEQPTLDPKEYNYDILRIAEEEIKRRTPRLIVARKHNDGKVDYYRLDEVFYPTE